MNLDSPTEEIDLVPDEPAGYVPGSALHVVFIPDRSSPRFFVWGEGAPLGVFEGLGAPESSRLPDESLKLRDIEGIAVPLLAALPRLAAVSASELSELPPSLAAWSLAAKLALDVTARERVAPRIVRDGDKSEARSCVSLSLREDHERFVTLAKAFPLAAHAVPVAPTGKRGVRVWPAEDLVRIFLDLCADVLVRAANLQHAVREDESSTWSRRLVDAIGGSDAQFAATGFQERSLIDELDAWVQPIVGSESGAPRAAFRLEMPDRDTSDSQQRFWLRFLLQSADDSSLQIGAADVFAAKKKALSHIHSTQRVAEERLLQSLSVAGKIFPPIERSLHEAKPDSVELTSEQAWKFLSEAAPALTEGGMAVIVPAELTRTGQRRLRMRMRIGGRGKGAQSDARSHLSMREALSFRWEAEIGGETLSIQDLKELAALKAPLVRYRGQWVAVDSSELEQAARLLSRTESSLSATAALAAALGSGVGNAESKLPVEVTVEGQLANVMEQLRGAQTNAEVKVPAAFQGEMRPYQERGLAWLAQMSRIGLGACLADDMGLGKTIQLLAYLLHRIEGGSDDPRPVLLICPTSVIGNWRHEFSRFAPSLDVVLHYGAERMRDPEQLSTLSSATVVITSYGLLRRDAALLGEVDWAVIALDEAQNIKNPESRTARVARSLHADFRVALTGTPVENRLSELWSIYEFLNPGLLGPLATFRREVAIPIERFGREDVSERLKRVVRPLLLRRVKSDPAVIQDLPPKQEMDVHCILTREQASLYQSAVDIAMTAIEEAEGIERRGQVLALITALKQICNHPAQYLGEAGPLAQRSGKLQRLVEMLDEVAASGERALVFTQYREMGERLVRELKRVMRTDVMFLHGGTPREQRDLMVKRFQESKSAPRVFVLSVKAGGTGLNLTAATHVFHFDRWWNPAVEDQATDRAYRIGQQHHVQVHKFLCAGTIEEKIDAMLKSKRDLASRIVGEGEQWITELDNAELRELFALSPGAVIDSESNGEGGGEGNGDGEGEAA